MSREEYLEQLACLLQDIADDERREALEFYRNYFEEAGEGAEEQVITDLGSPEKAARQIKNGLKEESEETLEYTETGYHNSVFEKDSVLLPDKKKNKVPNIALIILLCILASPLIFSVLGTGLGIIAGVFFGLLGFVIALLAMTFAALVAGIALVGVGIANLFWAPAIGCLVLGIGLLSFAVGILLLAASKDLLGRVIPGLIRKIAEGCRKLFKRGEARV